MFSAGTARPEPNCESLSQQTSEKYIAALWLAQSKHARNRTDDLSGEPTGVLLAKGARRDGGKLEELAVPGSYRLSPAELTGSAVNIAEAYIQFALHD
jgi:hypothetical protein